MNHHAKDLSAIVMPENRADWYPVATLAKAPWAVKNSR